MWFEKYVDEIVANLDGECNIENMTKMINGVYHDMFLANRKFDDAIDADPSFERRIGDLNEEISEQEAALFDVANHMSHMHQVLMACLNVIGHGANNNTYCSARNCGGDIRAYLLKVTNGRARWHTDVKYITCDPPHWVR